MKTSWPTLTMVLTFIATAQSAPFPWINAKPYYLSQPQEQASAGVRCFSCSGPNCPSEQREVTCQPGFVCTTIQAFNIVLNTSVVLKGCYRGRRGACTPAAACGFRILGRPGDLRSCSVFCCNTDLCNPSNVSTISPPTTTTSPPTTTTAPPTTTLPPTTTAGPPTTTTAPPTTTPPPTTLPTTGIVTTPFRPGPCGGPLIGLSGYFASPYYPLSYPNNAYCVWTIIVPPGSVLRIDFVDFKTEKYYDFVKVYVGTRLARYLTGDDVDDKDDSDKHKCDGKDEGKDKNNGKDQTKGKDKDKDDKDDDEKDISGWYFRARRHKAVTIHGTGKMIRIVFRADSSITKKGFYAKYIVMQGAHFWLMMM